MKTPRILCNYPHPQDSTSFYRGARPFGALSKIMDVNLIMTQATADWELLSMCDVVFLQRPFSHDHRAQMDLAHKYKIPVWIDYDDDLFSVPVPNKAWPFYQNRDIRYNVEHLMKNADVITTTTPTLAAKIKSVSCKDNVKIVPNAFDDYIFSRPDYIKPRKNILWRGTDTHDHDVMMVSKQVIEIAKEFTDWSWTFLGYNPWYLTTQLPPDRTQFIPFLRIEEYFKYLAENQPFVTMIPLAPNEFNAAKSNCSWIETSHAGSTCIAPNTDSFQMPGIINYNNPDDFAEKLRAFLKDPTMEHNHKSWKHIEENLKLSYVNRFRQNILIDLLGK